MDSHYSGMWGAGHAGWGWGRGHSLNVLCLRESQIKSQSKEALLRSCSQHFLPWSSPWPVGTYVLMNFSSFIHAPSIYEVLGKDSAVPEVWSCPWSLFPPTLNSSINRLEKLDRMSTSF